MQKKNIFFSKGPPCIMYLSAVALSENLERAIPLSSPPVYYHSVAQSTMMT